MQLPKTWCALLLFAVVACGRGDDSGSVDVDPATLSLPLLASNQVAPFDAADVARARAACVASGDVDPIANGQDLAHKVLGAWLRCDAKPSDEHQGLQLLPAGSLAILTSDGHGGLTTMRGYDGTGRWTLAGYDAQLEHSDGPNALWYLDLSCGGCLLPSSAPAFERSPRRMKEHKWAEGGWQIPLVHGG